MQGFDFSAMNYVDYISLIIVFISIGFGFYRGFVTSAISLVGWVLSIVLTYQFYPTVEQHLLNYINTNNIYNLGRAACTYKPILSQAAILINI